MVTQAIALYESDGALSEPDRYKGKGMSEEKKDQIIAFFSRETVSKPLPGIRDSVKQKAPDGSDILIPKRLCLATLHDLYLEACQDLNFSFGFSSFCALRPSHIVLASHHSAHAICVCTIHENIELAASV